jgi:hypothetical protein
LSVTQKDLGLACSGHGVSALVCYATAQLGNSSKTISSQSKVYMMHACTRPLTLAGVTGFRICLRHCNLCVASI